MRIETDNIPKSLLSWLKKNEEKIAAVSYEGGYAFVGSNDWAYDILLNRGWSTDEGMHTIIEPTVHRTLSILRTVAKCECNQCKETS